MASGTRSSCWRIGVAALASDAHPFVGRAYEWAVVADDWREDTAVRFEIAGIDGAEIGVGAFSIILAAPLDRRMDTAGDRIAAALRARVEIATLDGHMLAPVRGGIARVGSARIAVIAFGMIPAAPGERH
jgi:hypothetical protein